MTSFFILFSENPSQLARNNRVDTDYLGFIHQQSAPGENTTRHLTDGLSSQATEDTLYLAFLGFTFTY